MEIPQEIEKAILEAENKALSSIGEDGPNVVPVSTIFFDPGKIILVDYFFNKTTQNILLNNKVSLVCWSGVEGYQIKGICTYSTEENILLPIKEWVKDRFPDREVKGVLVIVPNKIYDVGARANSGKLVWPVEK